MWLRFYEDDGRKVESTLQDDATVCTMQKRKTWCTCMYLTELRSGHDGVCLTNNKSSFFVFSFTSISYGYERDHLTERYGRHSSLGGTIECKKKGMGVFLTFCVHLPYLPHQTRHVVSVPSNHATPFATHMFTLVIWNCPFVRKDLKLSVVVGGRYKYNPVDVSFVEKSMNTP